MAALYQEEVTRRLEALSEEIERSFQGNQQALTYKKIAQIAVTSYRRQPGLSGTPSQNNRIWEQHFPHLFRQEDIQTNLPGGSDSLIVNDQKEDLWGETACRSPVQPSDGAGSLQERRRNTSLADSM
jgi:hypothetical protein